MLTKHTYINGKSVWVVKCPECKATWHHLGKRSLRTETCCNKLEDELFTQRDLLNTILEY